MRTTNFGRFLPGIIFIVFVALSCKKDDSGKITADFKADRIVAAVSSEINITDLTEGKNEITAWLWDFGDGTTSIVQNPKHTYDAARTYSVTLTASNAYGSATETKVNYIDVVGPVMNDVEGNEYPTVVIGNQAWMAENLWTTKYKNGNDIPLVEEDNLWIDRKEPAYCWYENNKAEAITAKFGAMYNFHTVNTGNLCPTGWHVPDQEEWHGLFYYLAANSYTWDGTLYSGDNLEEALSKIAKSVASTSGWNISGNNGAVGNDLSANDSSGLSYTAGGGRPGNLGDFYNAGNIGRYWSSTTLDGGTTYARLYDIWYDRAEVMINSDIKSSGYSVRCVKDRAGADE